MIDQKSIANDEIDGTSFAPIIVSIQVKYEWSILDKFDI